MKHQLFASAKLRARKASWLLISSCVLSMCAVAIVRSNLSEDSPPKKFWSRSTPRRSDVADSATEVKVVSRNQAPHGALFVSLLPTGFEPPEVTFPAGKFLFGVNNRTGLSDLRFQLIDDKGKSVGEKRMAREKIWRKVIEPKPGRYVLRVVGHPAWRCELTITP